MAPYIHVIRHAQGQHNVSRRWDLVEPDLTGEGMNQCTRLQATTRGIRNRITHVISSPSWRCIRTAVVSFPDAIQSGMEVVLNPDLQEVASSPCNIPHEIATIRSLGGEYVNTTLLVENPNYRDRGPFSPYRWATEAVEMRARSARVWLRQLARAAGDDAHIVVVTHGAFAPWLVGGDVEPWYHTTLRSYQFVDLDGADGADGDGAALVEADEVDLGEESEADEDVDMDDGDDDDNDDDNDDGGGDGGPGMPRGILKRRRDDDDHDTGGGASEPKRSKTVAWATQLERVRVFNSRLDAIDKAKAAEKVSTKKERADKKLHLRDKRRHPALFVQYNKRSISQKMALRARQLQRFADKFPKDEAFSAVEFTQARAVQPLDAIDGKKNEEAWPKLWAPSNPERMTSINAFLSRWRRLFPGMDASALFNR